MSAPAAACAVILAGGAGTRIRALYPDVPKPLIPVAGRPFLDWVRDFWIGQGIRRFAVSVGHLAEQAERHVAHWERDGYEATAVREERPLGTGGALRFAARAFPDADPVLALNGDSLVYGDFSGAWDVLASHGVEGVVAAVRMKDAARYGTLRSAPDGRLLGFEEKRPGAGWINAGIYLLRRKLFERFPPGDPLSMEYDVFPALVASGACLRVYPVEGEFLDIGLPEDCARAGEFVRRHAHEPTP
jgi:D-glycero-alpha-D-manno-heptose 1-phosphate guanylyltransferase